MYLDKEEGCMGAAKGKEGLTMPSLLSIAHKRSPVEELPTREARERGPIAKEARGSPVLSTRKSWMTR